MNTCEHGCQTRHKLRGGLCPKHYDRLRRLGTTTLPERPRRNCSVEGCERPYRRSGLCDMHDQRQKRHGSPLAVQIQGDDVARFMQYVATDSNGCWLWVGVRHKTRGYGRFYVGGRGGRFVQAHRWSYEHHVAPIPAGLHIDHLCRVRQCVNPAHLEPVTPAENNRRAAAFKMR